MRQPSDAQQTHAETAAMTSMQADAGPWLATGDVLILGDSLTEGPGVAPEETYVARLNERPGGLRFIAQGRSGWSTGSYLRRMAEVKAQLPAHADAVLVQLGANDLRERGHDQTTIDSTLANLQTIFAMAAERYPGAALGLVAPPTFELAKLDARMRAAGFGDHTPHWLARLGTAYRQLCAQRGLRWVNLFEALGEGLTYDGAHPNAAGHRRVAAAMAAQLGLGAG